MDLPEIRGANSSLMDSIDSGKSPLKVIIISLEPAFLKIPFVRDML
jgi:hypothetical protein